MENKEVSVENQQDATNSKSEVENQADAETQDAELTAFPLSIKVLGDSKTTIQVQVTALDSMQDIRQYLYESLEACYITNYSLTSEGTKLNDFAEIGDIPSIKANSVLEMQKVLYDERSIKFQVRRTRDLISFSNNVTSPSSLFEYLTPKEDKESSTINSSDVPQDKKESLLSDYFSATSNVSPSNTSCLTSLTFSGWNPPPKYRKLQGDLIYLSVSTLENKVFHISGSTKGFYVNSSSSTVFNPNASDKPFTSYTLVGLLNQISPLFKKNFGIILNEAFSRHPFEMFPVPVPISSWVSKKEKHLFDLNRSEDSLSTSPDIEFRGLLRDWNEEYQTCKELPKETIQERIVRDRALFKVNADFVEAAMKGATLIVERSIPPINPLDNEKSFMYIYNNIFFSYAMDGRDLYKEYGGDKAAYISVNNDLKGVKLLNKADVKGLYTLATAIIDYRGHRVVAQSIIPGILQREQTSNVVYGSIDNGDTINADSSFHDLLVTAAKSLHIKEHKVVDSKGASVTLVTPIESKGIVGTDNRKYILDLVRLTPRDANYDGKQNLLSTIRPELIAAYMEHLKQQELAKRRQEKENSKKDQSTDSTTTPTESTTTTTPSETTSTSTSNEEKKEEEKQEEEEEEEEIEVSFGGFNVNVLCGYKLENEEGEEVKKDIEVVKDISVFLKETMIPIFIEDLAWITPLPLDGETLTKNLHNHGINIRYLGHIAKIADKIHILKELVIREMISRSAKHIFRQIIRETEDHKLAGALSHLLNCFLGNAKSTKDDVKQNKKKDREVASVYTLSSNLLWERIVEDVKSRFLYELPTSRESLFSVIRNYSTLRSICVKVGIQIETRDYDFSLDSPFVINDIVSLFPIVKHSEPQSYDGSNLLEAGKTFLTQGRLDIAYELLTQALAIFHQVYGPMHKDTASCYGHLSTVLYHAKDLSQSLDNQEKSTIIHERVEGLDKYDTIHSYLNLALLSHSMGKHKSALQYVHHALYLTRLVGGKNHPDTATVYINIASMLQEQQLHKFAIEYYQEALAIYEALIGTSNLQTAAIYHAIAIAYSQIGSFKEALVYEKKNYTILHEKVGDEDLRTVESNICLKQFTAKAVQMQIETKKAQRDITSQLSQVKLDKLRNTTGAISIPQPGKSLSSAASTAPMGSRPLNEVLAFINSGNKSKKSFSERNSKKSTPKN